MDMPSQFESTYPAPWPEAPWSSDCSAQENVGWNWDDFEKLTFNPSVNLEPDSHGTVLDGVYLDEPIMDTSADLEPNPFGTMLDGEDFDEPMVDTSVDPEPDRYGTTLDGFAPAAVTAPAMPQNDGVSHGLVREDAQLLAQPPVAPPPPSSMVAVPGTARQSGIWWHQESVTPDDWEDIRPFFVQLYIEENVKLEDVMATLAKHLNFNASMKMYKTQITRWGLRKNYKASEKEHITRVLKSSHETGRAPAPLNIRGRPVQLHRVRRHCKKQGSLPALLNNSLAAVSQADRSEVDNWIRSHVGRLSSVTRSDGPQKHLSLTTTNDRIELVLKQTEIYLENAFLTIDTNDVNDSKALAFSDKVWDSANLLDVGRFDEGWRELALACDMAHEALMEGAMKFLRHVVAWHWHSGYNKFPDARLRVLRFLARLSAAKLGPCHPISVVLYHMLDDEVSSNMVRPFLDVMKDTTLRIRAMDSDEVMQIQLDQVGYLMHTRNDLQEAEAVCLQCVDFCCNSSSRDDYNARIALMQLGVIYHKSGRYDDALAIFDDVLSRGKGDGSEPDWIYISTKRHLAWTYEALGDTQQSVEHWYRALEMGLAMWDLDHVEMTVIVAELEESFRYQGIDPEPWLQDCFGIFNT